MSKKDFQNGYALGLVSGGVVEVEIPAKEEQEKTVTITENGTTEILPDENKALSKVTVVTDISGGGTETTVEYIESTGTQYIDTGIVPTNHRVRMKFQKTDSLGSSIFGCYGTTALTDSYELTWYQGKWYYSNGQKNTNHPTIPPAVTDVVTLDYFTFDNKVIMNGNEVGTTYNSSVSSNSLYLFGKNATYQQLSNMKLWYAQIYDRATEELVRDFVPAIDDDGVICLYDNVTETYFYNQGEGEFIGGFVESELVEIETLIDESGVLDSTEGTATEKVVQLIEFAEELGVFHYIENASKLFYNTESFPTKATLNFPNAKDLSYSFAKWTDTTMPMVEEIVINASNYSIASWEPCMGRMFQDNKRVKKVVLNVRDDTPYMGDTFFGAENIEEIVLNFSTKNLVDINTCYDYCLKLKKIVGVFDFSSITNCNNTFYRCYALEDITFAPNTIYKSLSFGSCSKLSAESIQSIIDGLATVETAQTLAFNSAIVLTDEQKAQIYDKGWTLTQ